MSITRISLISAAAGIVLWALFSWPLPRHFFTGIPAAAHPERVDVEVMRAGDHLQLLYHYWLAGDMVSGRTPLFRNLYEFNVGNDEERFDIGPYYVPFSLVYAVGSAIGGRAFGWNVTGLISILLTFLFTWLLARRYTSNEFVAALSSSISVALPYRWISLLGGSPTGFAMMWVPMIWLGVDIAVREGRVRGGVLAGSAILFASCTDMHVFFFSVLAVPFWCVLAVVGRENWAEPRQKIWSGPFKALVPVVLFSVFAVVLPELMNRLNTLVTGMAPAADMIGRRTLREVLLYSPGWQGFFSWRMFRGWGEIYIGFPVLLIIAAGSAVVFLNFMANPQEKWRALVLMLLLAVGIMGIGALAMGVRGPAGGLLLRFFRFIIPPYGMIRQPAKIFCLMPSFLALALAIGLSALAGPGRSRARKLIVPALCVGIVLGEYSLRIYPHICLLKEEQGAYAAVSDRAAERGTKARSVVVPLWPGDAHFASVYQYFSSLYRIRMLNGYAPFVKRDYFDDIFLGFKSINRGELSEDQADALLGMGIDAVLVHEDLFPEKVSPFPVTFTLRQLLNHPRLAFLKQDGTVWAFEILPEPVEREDDARWTMFGSARRWEAQSCTVENALLVEDEKAGAGAFVRFSDRGARLRTGGEHFGRAPDMYWMVRARGEGTLQTVLSWEKRDAERTIQTVQSPVWTWLTVPIKNTEAYERVALELERETGIIDVDTILLAAGRWEPPGPGEVLCVPAPAFFHAGYIDRTRDSVVFRKDRHADSFVFYGPKLPLEKGVYEVEIMFRTGADPGTPLGWFMVERPGTETEQRNEVRAGERAVATFRHAENQTVNLAFAFLRNADMEIDCVAFRRKIP